MKLNIKLLKETKFPSNGNLKNPEKILAQSSAKI
jgi:hypothetical protein